MTLAPTPTRRIAFTLGGIIAVTGALMLLFIAAFPYFYAESGSAGYARAHRVEAIAEVVAALALLWVSWQCFRRAMSKQTMLAVAALLLLALGVRSLADYARTPSHLRPVGGAWHVVAVHRPSAIDTVYYQLFYKRRVGYENIHDLVGETRFVAPDCLVFRGLKVVGRPVYAMCGYRSPVQATDTLIAESDLLQQARQRPPYRIGWQAAQ